MRNLLTEDLPEPEDDESAHTVPTDQSLSSSGEETDTDWDMSPKKTTLCNHLLQ